MIYSIKYGTVDPGSISDRAIVRNPNYGKPLGPWSTRPVKPDKDKFKGLKDFYEKLEQSVKQEGFRNPIFCHAFLQNTYCEYGTSRLWIAKRNTFLIPVVIADYDGRWGLPTLNSVRSVFTDQPEELVIGENDMRISGCPQ